MDYIPQPPKQQVPQPVYELKKDSSGEEPVVRGEQIVATTKGHKVKVPHLPNKNCNKCYGRGYTGYILKLGYPIMCKKCYPRSK